MRERLFMFENFRINQFQYKTNTKFPYKDIYN